jgi:hypothetical protein
MTTTWDKTAYIDDKSDPAEWKTAWDKLAERYGSYDCCDPQTHEMWQYMGSWDDATTGKWFHNFRHRSLPPSQARVYWNAEASDGWNPQRWYKAPKLDECPF